MLSSSVIKNVGQASHYYSQQDNYYTREQGIEQSEWWGKGAEKLELSGQVETKQFTDLLSGKLPSGEQIGKIVDGSIRHRPGWDLTFSAPKSVSILALIGGDKRLLDAHRESVSIALSYVERSCSQVRVQTPSGIAYQNSNNIVAALYHHDLSREKDPQLHTHSVVMNMTERHDGKWRSLASKIGGYGEKAKGEINGFIERVRHNNRYFTKLYETELAFRVKKLGYEITTDTKSGVFEISGVSRDVVEFFSKRRKQIEDRLSEKGLSGGKAASVATLDTRIAKEDVDREKLKYSWERDASQLGIDCQKIIHDSMKNKLERPVNEQIADQDALKAIRSAAKALSVFKSTFTLEEVVTDAFEYAVRNNLKVESVFSAAKNLISSGEILSLPNERGKTVLMTKSTLDEEKRVLSVLEDKKMQLPLIDRTELKYHLMRHNDIHNEKHGYIETVFGNERIVLISGDAAGNSLIDPIVKIANSENLKVALISPSMLGSKKLANRVGQVPKSFLEKVKLLFTDSTTKHYSIMQFLSGIDEKEISKYKSPNVLIVENSELLSTHQMAKLFEWNKENNAKLILFGRKTALVSQQVGMSLDKLCDHGVTDISYKYHENSLMRDIEERNIQAVAKKMTDRIIEVKNQEDRYHAMVKHYCKLGNDDRRKSWIVASNKTSVNELNLIAHQSLLAQEKLGKASTVNVLVPCFLSSEKGVLAASYQKGQVVRFNENYKGMKINHGEYLRVIRHSKASNRVVLQKENGKHFIWSPDKVGGGIPGKVELFSEVKREFSINETIIANRSLKSQGVVKGDRMYVSGISKRMIKLRSSEGKLILLDLNKPNHRHIDYGYAATLHAISHEQPSVLIAELPARSFHSDQRHFNQVVLQPKEAWIYTDNHNGLVSHLERNTGDRPTAVEVLSHAQELKKNLHSLYNILEKKISERGSHHGVSTPSQAAVEAVEYAMNHLAEREAGFTHKDLMYVAMNHALGKVTSDELNKATVAMENEGIVSRGYRSDGTLWTTADAVRMEREIIALCNQDKGKLEPIANDELLGKHCDPTKLSSEQVEAVTAITQSRDRVMAVQGHPGTGKTTMFATVSDVLIAKNIYTSEGYAILGLAPTHTAVKQLSKRGIPSQTLDSFIFAARRDLADLKETNRWDRTIIIIDEASMVSNRKMKEVLHLAHQLECRGVIPAGDTRQLQSIESGKSFELLQTQVNTQSLVDIHRQSDETPVLKQAVKETISYNFRAAFETLRDSIIEVPPQSNDISLSKSEIRALNRHERVTLLVNDYFSFSKDERHNIQIITPGHDDRMLANTLIRERLKEEGSLAKGEEQCFSILRAKSLTQVERSHITNLGVGDVLRFGRRESAYIKGGQYFAIASINSNHGLITLKGEDGRQVMWQVPTFDKKRLSSIEVFRRESRDLQVGDVIRWSRSDKKNELLGTEVARVVAVEQNKVTVELANKRLFTFNPHSHQFQHWDHGYAATVYAVQGKTKDIILAHMESFRENLTNQPAFLVALTRAVNTFRLYTDNVEKLLKTIERNTGVKLSSLEVIGQFPNKILKKLQKTSPQTTLSDLILPASKTGSIKENRQYFDRDAISRIKEGLNNNSETIATNFLGAPKEKGGSYLKFGRNQGSLTVTVKGEKQGWFNDFETNKGGRDMLKFIQIHGGMDKSQALEYGARWLGIPFDMQGKPLKTGLWKDPVKAGIPKEISPTSFSDYEKSRIKLANKIANEALPVKGTLAERYLKEYRGIDLENVPEDIRFHPNVYSGRNQKGLPALIAVARNHEGKIQSVEAIYLDPMTADKANVPLPKQTIGPKKNATVMINQADNLNTPTLVAEGVVTGLSLAKSLPNVNVLITLGKQMFTSIDPDGLSQKVIFCLDNDGKNLKTDGTIFEAARRVTEARKDVSFMVPNGLDMKKQDYNDILKQRGSEAIQKDFLTAIPYDNFYKDTGRGSSFSSAAAMQFSREMIKDTMNRDKAYLGAYRSIVESSGQSMAEKTLTRIQDIEREI